MQRTPNLGLPQFEPSDKYRLEDYNEAYMKIDEKVKELKDKEAQLDTKLAEAQSIIDTWTQFKNSGGVINGDIKLPRGFALCGTINGNRDALIYQSSQPNDNGRVIVGSSGQTTQIASELRPEVYWNLLTHKIILDSDYVSDKSQNGYTKLPNGLIMQWGLIKTTLTADGQNVTGTITLPIQFPNACRFAVGRPTFVDGGSYKASLYNGAVTVINNSTLQMYFMRHTNGPTISEPVDVTWLAIGY